MSENKINKFINLHNLTYYHTKLKTDVLPKYLPLSGGTMSGNISFSDTDDASWGIFATDKTTNDLITASGGVKTIGTDIAPLDADNKIPTENLPDTVKLLEKGTGDSSIQIKDFSGKTTGKNSVNLSYSGETSGDGSFAEGNKTTAKGKYSHAEGVLNVPSNNSIHSIGVGNNDTDKQISAEEIYYKTDSSSEDTKNGYKYLIDLGGFDGTNFETDGNLNPDIKSVQEILNKLVEKAGGLDELFSPYKAVDLGLESGLKWANMNIGATSETDAGLYFQWGDTKGYTVTQLAKHSGDTDTNKKYFCWTDYKYCNSTGDTSVITKYNSSDSATTLESSDDAATANMGSKWRMPTNSNFNELIRGTTQENVYKLSDGTLSATTGTVTTGNDVSYVGKKFINKSDSSKYIILPSSGFLWQGDSYYVGGNGYCWSSSLLEGGCRIALGLYFDSEGMNVYGYYRPDGFPVRGVLAQ